MDQDGKSDGHSIYETVVFSGSGNPHEIEAPKNQLVVGDVLCDIYVLTARLGRGGMGEVWKADEVYEGKPLRQVVIKTIASNIQNVEEELARVKGMFHKIHGLQHQHICPLYGMKNDPEHGTIIIMKFIDGMMLQEYREEYFKQHAEFPVSEVTRLLLPIAQALDYSHSKKVLHRDVKPQNILISREEADGAQLIDFGLVADLQTSVAANTQTQFDTSGTLPYMSPEQWSGEFQDGMTDQFSLAAVVYELLAGRLPFVATNIQVLGFQILNKDPSPIEGLSDYTNRAILRALSKNRRERFSSCSEFIRALEDPSLTDVSDEKVLQAEPTTAPRSKWILPAIVLVAFFLVAGVGSLYFLGGIPSCEPQDDQVARNPQVAQNDPADAAGSDDLASGAGQDDAAPGSGVTSDETSGETPDKTSGDADSSKEDSEDSTTETVEDAPATDEGAAEKESKEDLHESSREIENEAKDEEDSSSVKEEEPPQDELEGSEDADSATSQAERESASLDARYAEAFSKADSGDYDAAYPLLESLFSALAEGSECPEDVQLTQKFVEASEKTGHWNSARKGCQALIRRMPNDLELRKSLLRFCMEGQDYLQAVEQASMILEEEPENREVLRQRAMAQSELCRTTNKNAYYTQALADYEKLITLEPDNARNYACRGYAYFRNPSVNPMEKPFERAKNDFAKALEMDPSDEFALIYQGVFLRDVFRETQQALDNFAKVERINPKNVQVYYQRAHTYFGMNQNDIALEQIEVALDLAPENNEALSLRGQIYLRQNVVDQAWKDFSTVLTYLPQNVEVRRLRAKCSLRLERYVEAKSDYERLLQEDPNKRNHIEYHTNLASIFRKAKRSRDAQRHEDAAQAIRANSAM
ncbi:MAG: protein kinase [Planctomycetia bacterium]|nr:protein kinase [Planctomycetia bacterium]